VLELEGMKSFSVLSVSKRTGWGIMALSSVAIQTVQPEQWVVVHEDTNNFLDDIKYTTQQSAYKIRLVDAPSKTKLSNLNASLNEGLRYINTDYVIFYQDFIELPKDCFEKLLELATPKTFVTTCTPNYDGTDDRRFTGCNLPRPCAPAEWETNVAIAPTGILRELGGFDEEYDWGWSWDNVNVAERAAMLGAKFICDESNRPRLYPHEMSSHETLPKNGERHAKTMRDIRDGRKPLKLSYL
jgi:hypothetical protein